MVCLALHVFACRCVSLVRSGASENEMVQVFELKNVHDKLSGAHF